MAQSFFSRIMAPFAGVAIAGWIITSVAVGTEHHDETDKLKVLQDTANAASWNNYLWEVVDNQRSSDGTPVGSLGVYLRDYLAKPDSASSVSSLSPNVVKLRTTKVPSDAFPDIYSYVQYNVFKPETHLIQADTPRSGGQFDPSFIQQFVQYEAGGLRSVEHSTHVRPRREFFPEKWINWWSWLPITLGFGFIGAGFPFIDEVTKRRRYRQLRRSNPLMYESQTRLRQLLSLTQNNGVKAAVKQEREILAKLQSLGRSLEPVHDSKATLLAITREQAEVSASIDAQMTFLESQPSIS
jgi:hypothetical protein